TTVTGADPVLCSVRYTAATSLPGVARIQAFSAVSCAGAAASAPESIARQAGRYAKGCFKRSSAARVVGWNALDYARRGTRRFDYDALPAMTSMTARTDRSELLALLALFGGALAIGSSGIFVRLSQTGPTATAFWRGALALPFLAVWAWLERRGASAPRATLREPLFIWAGVFFAGDLLLWHWSLLLTSIAAATLEANCAPLLVTLLAWLLGKERPRPAFLFAIALAFGGMLLILAPKLGGGSHAL